MTQVAIMMGSDSDLPVLEEAAKVLQEFGVSYQMRVLSAHRTPAETVQFVSEAVDFGVKVFICAAGMAAHLAGVVAAHTVVPVLGVPLDGGMMQGMDALLSTVQMPPGVPVGTLAVGKAGAKNAALLAVRILALNDEALEEKLYRYRDEMRQAVLAKDEALQKK